MSRIRADRIVNRAANGPVEAAEGISIPSNKSIILNGNSGSVGQYIGVTANGLAWGTPAGSGDGPAGTTDYNALTNKPTLFSGSWNDLTNRPLNTTVTTNSPSGISSLSYNQQTSVLTYTPPDLSNYVLRNSSETFTSLAIQNSVTVPSIFTNQIRTIDTDSVNFPTGISTSSINIGGTLGSPGQFLRASPSGIEWSTVNIVAENSSPTFSNVSVTGDLNVVGTITTNNLTTLNVTNSQIVLNDSVEGNPTSDANLIVNRGILNDTSIRWNELTDRWEFTNDGTNYSVLPLPSEYNDYTQLINRPVLPPPQVQVDWNSSVGLSSILNKPELFGGAYDDLTNKPAIPVNLSDLTDVSNVVALAGNVLRWDGSSWTPSEIGGGDGGGTLIGPVISTDKAIPRYSGENGTEISDSLVTISDTGAIQAPKTNNLIPFFYPTIAELPNATLNSGAIAYVESGNALYYAANSSWTGNRIVTTTSSTTSDLESLIDDFQKTYSTSAQDVTINNTNQPDRKALRLSDSLGITSDIIIKVSSGLNISRSTNELTLTGRTYALSAEEASGNATKLRVTETGTSVNVTDITFVGADGLIVERTDNTTITFRAPENTVTQYTDSLAKDAAALMLINGSKVGITYTYDSVNKVLNSVVSGGGDGSGTVITYDLAGRNTNSNNAFIDLIPSSGLTDTIEFAGSAGTTVNWDSGNKRITIGSVAPVQADWNQTNNTSLNFIQNKPTIPPAYTLPTASSSVIGGVRIGDNLSIDVNGILSANAGGYTLPAATGSTLGGIKIGSGLSIDGNGVVNATVASSVQTIQELSGTTASLAPDVTAELNIVGYKAYSLFKIQTNAESWIRIYTDDVSRDADVTRSEGQDPVAGSGVIAEIRTDGIDNNVLITPGILGFNNDSPRTTTIYLSVTNRSAASTAITVTLTALKIGE
jgi:hypothetical protein